MKLNFKEWLEENYDLLTKEVWTSKHEKQVLGFAPSDLSHFRIKELEKKYNKYLNK